jgi:hypothetical protein
MNSITTTYPDFQSLPKGIKRMLVVSESLFFEDAKAMPKATVGQPGRDIADSKRIGGRSPPAVSLMMAMNRS